MKHNDTKLQGPENATGRVAAFHGFSDQAVRRLTLLDRAETLGDLAGLPSNRLEALRGVQPTLILYTMAYTVG